MNNAGTNTRKPVLEATSEEYATITQTNMESCFFLSKYLHPFLKKVIPFPASDPRAL